MEISNPLNGVIVGDIVDFTLIATGDGTRYTAMCTATREFPQREWMLCGVWTHPNDILIHEIIHQQKAAE